MAVSKDLLEQLRTIHFTLLLICLAATVIALTPDATPLSKAASQLDLLLQIQSTWGPDSFKTALASMAGGGTCVNRQMPDGEALNIHAKVGPFRIKIIRKWDVRYDAPEQYRQEGQVGDLEMLARPNTLQDFKALWSTHVVLSCPKRDLNPKLGEFARGWSMDAHSFAGTPPVKDAFVRSPSKYPEKEFVWVDSRRSGPWRRAALFEISTEDFRWVLPANGRSESTDRNTLTLREVLNTINNNSLPDSSFENYFRELLSDATDKQAMPLPELKRVIEGQLTAERDSFSVFSVRFPLEASLRWAVVLIILAQLYFSLHFAEFCRLGRPSTEVAWIGTYDQIPARILTALTICVVPVAVVYLASRGETFRPYKPLEPLAVVFSSVISLGVAAMEIRRRRALASALSGGKG